MGVEAHKRLIDRFNEAVWQRGELDVIDEVYSPDLVWHSAPPGLAPGRDGLRMMIAGFRSAFSDIEARVDAQIAEADLVAWRWTFEGTHSSELMGVPATGGRVVFAGISIDRFAEDGKSVERRDFADMLGLLQQLGAVPLPRTEARTR